MERINERKKFIIKLKKILNGTLKTLIFNLFIFFSKLFKNRIINPSSPVFSGLKFINLNPRFL